MTAPIPSRAAGAQAPELLLEYHSDSAVLILNRPQTRNSLSEAMLTALSDALTEIAADKGVGASRPRAENWSGKGVRGGGGARHRPRLLRRSRPKGPYEPAQ